MRAAANKPFCVSSVVAIGDHLDATEMWQSLSAQWNDFVENLNNLDGTATVIKLSESWPGTTHLPMMDMKITSHPDRAHARGRDKNPSLTQLV